MNVNWRYRTILFEFHKDGLLGDRYIDDEDMEKVLNEQGEQGWELVSVTAVQEGLLSFFKQERPETAKKTVASVDRNGDGVKKAADHSLRNAAGQKEAIPAAAGQERKERPLGPAPVPRDTVGGIKIS